MTQAVIEAVINVSMLSGINNSHAKRWRRGNNHIHKEVESLSEILFGIQNTV
ncbi:hypothetical protein Gotur_028708, partial [Gossypium turneri]